ncbi:hypothetical protein FHS31_003106 [Sphingomonas vulcanisoli]|uniref:Uncharacterized protein n=1 Tax=Sphingomonas vulcanisoli TaxID=1658060 RepID=A0ABX0TVB6_9SPHN|nr:hypothetical protein [Sphingomonas vulcanisoli]NIJ09474.1 hypothetical protein [Sphingomonas vulcanisoli]
MAVARAMSEAARLAAEIDTFAAIVDELAAIAGRNDPQRRAELTKLRRRLSDQIGVMRGVGAEAFAEPSLAEEYRARLSKVLTAVSMHQANWPAIGIDEDTEAYRRSALAAAVGNRDFIAWARAALMRKG